MARLKIYFEIDGPGFYDPVGMCMDFGEIKDGLLTKEKYETFKAKVKMNEVLKLAGLSELADENKCRVIYQDEYEEKYGDK